MTSPNEPFASASNHAKLAQLAFYAHTALKEAGKSYVTGRGLATSQETDIIGKFSNIFQDCLSDTSPLAIHLDPEKYETRTHPKPDANALTHISDDKLNDLLWDRTIDRGNMDTLFRGIHVGTHDIVKQDMEHAGFGDSKNGWNLSITRVEALYARFRTMQEFFLIAAEPSDGLADLETKDIQDLQDTIKKQRALLMELAHCLDPKNHPDSKTDAEFTAGNRKEYLHGLIKIDGYVPGKDPAVDRIVYSIKAAHNHTAGTTLPLTCERLQELWMQMQREVAQTAAMDTLPLIHLKPHSVLQ